MADHSRTTFDPQALYKAAVSQLDLLLPPLSHDEVLPPHRTKRAITIHLPSFPSPSPGWTKSNAKHPTAPDIIARDITQIEKMFNGVVWQLSTNTKAVGNSDLCDVMDSIIFRVLIDGFVVCEV
ncbi:hypothetical protein SISSUDRAFT_1047851 [Sistotremastrum suecicum HHB10207 ss-3]|uniref:Uncharacterized protein n=1 Tax=Sistotremastrum suecicum HHB10207 ss-3 TaxID=1314776 RepID=A0A166CWH5_9AGAM|nr:hypothetical protein SISSUDRAFT_1047851 [Sistotremastrum suecicum HHB10207 ss-3]